MEKTGFKIDNETTPNNLTAVKPVLSDLAAQVHAFLELPEPFPAVESSYVVLAFGHWDIYHVAALDFAIGAEYIDAAVVEIFEQLQRIYSRAPGSLQAKHLPKIILPRLLGPSLAPGWLVQRPEPMAPRSVAWEQSTAAMLNKRWTEQMDLRLREWLEYAAPVEHIDYIGVDEASRLSGSETKAPTTMTPEASSPSTNGRIAYILDIPHLVQSIKINHYFARSKISDANNLGKHQDVYDDVDSSCAIRDSTDDNKRWHQPDRHQQRIVDISHGTLQCEKPGRWLWWDSWNLGGRVKERIAEVMSAMVREQHTAATTFLEEDRTQQLHQQREQARWRLKDMETEKHAQEDRARQEEEARAKKLKGLPER